MEQDDKDNDEIDNIDEEIDNDDEIPSLKKDVTKIENELDYLLEQLVNHRMTPIRSISSDDMKPRPMIRRISELSMREHRCHCGVRFLKEDEYNEHLEQCENKNKPYWKNVPIVPRIVRSPMVEFNHHIGSYEPLIIPMNTGTGMRLSDASYGTMRMARKLTDMSLPPLRPPPLPPLYYPSKLKNERCICRKCNNVFENNDEYGKHICSDKNDEIPNDVNGLYECQICHNKYVDEFLLGEHFITAHDSYDSLEQLDQKFVHGFPGFKLLKHIKMIKKVSTLNKYKLMKVNAKCGICDIEYYNDDIDSVDISTPVKMRCCNKFICKSCIKSHVSISDNLQCPYCMFDHTQTNKEYIIFIEIDDQIDKERWVEWWQNHVDLFLPSVIIN